MSSSSSSPKSPTLSSLLQNSTTPVDTARTWMLNLADDDRRKELMRALLPDTIRDLCRTDRHDQARKLCADIESGKITRMADLYQAVPDGFRRSTPALVSAGQAIADRETKARQLATVTGQQARGY